MEHRIHQWLKTNFDAEYARRFSFLLTGIGDDAAVLSGELVNRDQRMVVTSDMIAEGTHFRIDPEFSNSVKQRLSRFPQVLRQVLAFSESRQMSLFLAGRKLVAANLSDLAAMAAVPKFVTLNLQIPNSYSFEEVIAVLEGCRQTADQFELSIVGGDTNRWDGPLVLGATCVGLQAATSKKWRLSDALDGDWILASGDFGGSYPSEKHWCFTPRIELATYLAKHYDIHAATDATDSLTIDLNAIAQASGVQMKLELNRIPISKFSRESTERAAQNNAAERPLDPNLMERENGEVSQSVQPHNRPESLPTHLSAALYDGEDFELLFTASPETGAQLLADANLPDPIRHIGRVIAGSAGIVDDQGNEIPVNGYEH